MWSSRRGKACGRVRGRLVEFTAGGRVTMRTGRRVEPRWWCRLGGKRSVDSEDLGCDRRRPAESEGLRGNRV